MLPYANLFWSGVLVVIIGVVLASAFSAILVYAQELIPGKIGMVSGLFFGFAFGMGGIGAAVLGNLADHAGIDFVYKLCSFLPLLGVIAAFLPNLATAPQIACRGRPGSNFPPEAERQARPATASFCVAIASFCCAAA